MPNVTDEKQTDAKTACERLYTPAPRKPLSDFNALSIKMEAADIGEYILCSKKDERYDCVIDALVAEQKPYPIVMCAYEEFLLYKLPALKINLGDFYDWTYEIAAATYPSNLEKMFDGKTYDDFVNAYLATLQ